MKKTLDYLNERVLTYILVSFTCLLSPSHFSLLLAKL